jgi:NADH:ubiquinone oxidoreductase subunit 4 (subunit M)
MFPQTLLLVGIFFPLFPLSMVFNRLLGLLSHPAPRTAFLLVWPQVGVAIYSLLGEKLPSWILPWALLTALLYGFRLLAERDVHRWIGLLATSQWSLLWLPSAVSAQESTLIVYALGFSIPLVLMAGLAGGLDRRFGAAYTQLYGGLATTIPRYSAMLTLSVLAAIATPLFPGFFILLRLLLSGTPLILVAVPLTWLIWSWAGLRLLQGLVIGPDNHTERIGDSRRGLAFAYIVIVSALTVAGLYVLGDMP